MFLYERLKDEKQSPDFNLNVCVLSDRSSFLIHQEEKYLRFTLTWLGCDAKAKLITHKSECSHSGTSEANSSNQFCITI